MVSLQKNNFDKRKIKFTKQQSSFYSYFVNSPLTSTPLPNSSRKSTLTDRSEKKEGANAHDLTTEGYLPFTDNGIIVESTKEDLGESMCNLVPLFHEKENDDIIVVEENEPSLIEILTEDTEADDTIHFTPELFDNGSNHNSPKHEKKENCTEYQNDTSCMGSNAYSDGGSNNVKGAVNKADGLENNLNSCNIDINEKNKDALSSECCSVVEHISFTKYISNAEADQQQNEDKKRNRLSRSKNRGLSSFIFE